MSARAHPSVDDGGAAIADREVLADEAIAIAAHQHPIEGIDAVW
jgi:hypothetical protein